MIVRHVSSEISCHLTHFLDYRGEILYEVMDRRHSSFMQGGLEVPCCLTLSGKK